MGAFSDNCGAGMGMQFIAPVGAEDVLFQLAAQLEEHRPWFGRVADI